MGQAEMLCDRCNQPVRDGARFCPTCGNEQSATSEEMLAPSFLSLGLSEMPPSNKKTNAKTDPSPTPNPRRARGTSKNSIHYHNFTYPSFWRRVGGGMLDIFILGLGLIPLALILFWRLPLHAQTEKFSQGQITQVTQLDWSHILLVLVLLSLCAFIYFLQGDSGKDQGSYGIRFLGCKVVNDLGGYLSMERALARSALKIVLLPTIIGVLPIWDKKFRLTLYDRLTKTMAIMKEID